MDQNCQPPLHLHYFGSNCNITYCVEYKSLHFLYTTEAYAHKPTQLMPTLPVVPIHCVVTIVEPHFPSLQLKPPPPPPPPALGLLNSEGGASQIPHQENFQALSQALQEARVKEAGVVKGLFHPQLLYEKSVEVQGDQSAYWVPALDPCQEQDQRNHREGQGWQR
ncbi:hypothetical protein E2C01_020190 [Portunus trituberculatus]|uniref:Uncharacterized protein n=1 Tax=Portunus trituberculatus TaxID=210409 RepID=A0A5B7DZV7_PORTR|nr:hypothetical protein [Portunus trituberculatus]